MHRVGPPVRRKRGRPKKLREEQKSTVSQSISRNQFGENPTSYQTDINEGFGETLINYFETSNGLDLEWTYPSLHDDFYFIRGFDRVHD
jgi:hypothetical protein